jgi:site-specific DNA recombinase
MNCSASNHAMANVAKVVAIYARVSSEQQSQQQTIASQVAELRQRVASEGFSLAEDYCFLDDGYSGTTLQRPALERLRDAAYFGRIQRLYVHSPDRLARRYAHQVVLIDELEQCNVEVVFLNHAIGGSPEEQMLLQMQGMFAEYERAKILERCRRGRRHAAQRGSISVLSAAPFGYRYITKHEGGGVAAYEVLPEKAEIVRQVFGWVGCDRLSLGEVRRRLELQAVPSPQGKARWNRRTLWEMLKNTAYAGRAVFGKTRVGPPRPSLRTYRGRARTSPPSRPSSSEYPTPPEEQITLAVPPLVTEELFSAVQQQLAAHRQHLGTRRPGAHLLQGLLECGCCGYSYYGARTSRRTPQGEFYVYYRCTGMDGYRFGGKRICPNRPVRSDCLDEAVWNDVCQLLRQPQLVRQEYERRLQAPIDDSRRRLVQQQQHNAQRMVSRLIDAYADGTLEKQEFESRLIKARQLVTRRQEELTQLENQEAEQERIRQAMACLDEFSAHLSEGLEHADWHRRREIIRTLVERIRIEPDQMRIVYRISYPLFARNASRERILQFCWGRVSADGVE